MAIVYHYLDLKEHYMRKFDFLVENGYSSLNKNNKIAFIYEVIKLQYLNDT